MLMAHKIKIITCEMCKKTFRHKHISGSLPKYCPDCQRKKHIERQRKYEEKKKIIKEIMV